MMTVSPPSPATPERALYPVTQTEENFEDKDAKIGLALYDCSNYSQSRFIAGFFFPPLWFVSFFVLRNTISMVR
jgi:hypothetical protein